MSAPRAKGKKSRAQPLSRLLGSVRTPEVVGLDYRDASDAVGEAIGASARRNPDAFYRVLAEEPSLLDRHDVIWALGYEKDPRATPPLLVALRSKLEIVRAAAANGLERRRGAKLVDPLIAALRDPSSKVRERVIVALGKQRSARALEPLRAAAAKPSNRRSPHVLRLIEAAIARLEKSPRAR